MKKQKSSLQPDGSVLYKFFTVERSKPRKKGDSTFTIESTEWLSERSPKPKTYTARNGQSVTKYYYTSKKDAQRHSDYMSFHNGENIDDTLLYKRRNKLEEMFK